MLATFDLVAKEERLLAMTEAPPHDQVRLFVEANIDKDISQFVALAAERVVGWADVAPGWASGVAHRGNLGMGLIAEYRGQGLGRLLIETCIRKAWATGLTRIDLEVRADNGIATRLYETLGFQHEGRLPRGVRIDGVYFETLRMGLLRDGP